MVPMGPMRPMESMGLQLLLLAESVANQLGDALRHGAVAAKGTAHSMVLSLDGEVQMLEADGLTAPTFEVARQASLAGGHVGAALSARVKLQQQSRDALAELQAGPSRSPHIG